MDYFREGADLAREHAAMRRAEQDWLHPGHLDGPARTRECKDCEGTGTVLVNVVYTDRYGTDHLIQEDWEVKCPVCDGEGDLPA